MCHCQIETAKQQNHINKNEHEIQYDSIYFFFFDVSCIVKFYRPEMNWTFFRNLYISCIYLIVHRFTVWKLKLGDMNLNWINWLEWDRKRESDERKRLRSSWCSFDSKTRAVRFFFLCCSFSSIDEKWHFVTLGAMNDRVQSLPSALLSVRPTTHCKCSQMLLTSYFITCIKISIASFSSAKAKQASLKQFRCDKEDSYRWS